ncbi:DUF3618 domain-containing protein [Sphingosinicella sp. CPCC 101087]|uniref:DUF3618 domain-containing protein n=1 Tax=Sphingosinicella sp. CPCC 101087 TaxID=2497754 RepID=UPI00101DB52D|nr:DUF3618 domain-containing protein [Sphingosinicella sp. CPCC 101087]
MSLAELEQGKREVAAARRRLESTLGAIQLRLQPANLAGEAWGGVKEKGAELADGALTAVRQRPAAVGVALGAFALFLAREPLKRAMTRLVAGEEEDADEGMIVTRIETDDSKFTASAPIVDAALTEGVK